MPEITDEMIAHAKDLCKPRLKNQLIIIAEDTLIGIGAGGGVGAVFANGAGAVIGGGLGGLAGVKLGIKAANTPDLECVVEVLQQNSKGRY